MKNISGKYCAFFALSLAAGIFTANNICADDYTLALVVISAGAAAVALWSKRLVFIIIAAAFCAGLLAFSNAVSTDFYGILFYEDYEITGRVCEKPEGSGENTRYILKDVRVLDYYGYIELDKKAMLTSPDGSFEYGDIITFTGSITPPKGRTVPNGFDERLYLASKGVGFSTYSESIVKEGEKRYLYGAFVELRSALEVKIDNAFSQESAGVAKAVFLGVKDDLSDAVQESFSAAGISHVLAISGLHIGLLVAALSFILKKLCVRRNIKYALLTGFITCYVLITGLPVSVLRVYAFLMVLYVSEWLFMPLKAFDCLCISASLILLISPAQLFMPGFLLSYGAVIAIMCLAPKLNSLWKKEGRLKEWLIKPVNVSLSATAGTFVQTAVFFNGVSLLGPLINIIAVPCAWIIVVFTAMAGFAAFLSEAAARVIAFIPDRVIGFLVWLSGIVTRSGAAAEVYGVGAAAGLCVFFCIFTLSDFVRAKRAAKALMCAGAVIAAVICCVPIGDKAELTMTFLDVGYGDACHISAGEDDILITDLSGGAVYTAAEYAKNNGVAFDKVIIYREREDCTENAAELQEKMPLPRDIYCTAGGEMSEYFESGGFEVHTLEKYDKINIGGAGITVAEDRENKLSLSVESGGRGICLYCAHSAKKLDVNKSYDAVKAASGGSEYSLSPELLGKDTKYVIISVDSYDRYGLPSDKSTEIAENCGACVKRTDRDGSVILKYSDGKTIVRAFDEDWADR